jgi:hypothetical protein
MVMPILSKPSSAAGTAIVYITVGALLDVWGIVWWIYLWSTGSERRALYYICAGIILSGLTLLTIGLALGRIGRSARRAELPPPEVTDKAAAEPAVIIRTPAVPATPATPPVAAPAPLPEVEVKSQ